MTAGWHFSTIQAKHLYTTIYAEETFTMFTSEMLSMLSTCTSMPTGMAEPAEQKTQHAAVMCRITAMPLKST